MNSIKNITFLFFFLLLLSCGEYHLANLNKKIEKNYYSSKGFALVYEDSYFDDGLINKKLKNDEIKVMHSFLKRNTPVKIINPDKTFISISSIGAFSATFFSSSKILPSFAT